jgi:outer membrane protein
LISNQEQVRAASVAFEGVQAEFQVGLRTTLDVLNAQQELRNAELLLINSRRDAYVAEASVLASMGPAAGAEPD